MATEQPLVVILAGVLAAAIVACQAPPEPLPLLGWAFLAQFFQAWGFLVGVLALGLIFPGRPWRHIVTAFRLAVGRRRLRERRQAAKTFLAWSSASICGILPSAAAFVVLVTLGSPVLGGQTFEWRVSPFWNVFLGSASWSPNSGPPGPDDVALFSYPVRGDAFAHFGPGASAHVKLLSVENTNVWFLFEYEKDSTDAAEFVFDDLRILDGSLHVGANLVSGKPSGSQIYLDGGDLKVREKRMVFPVPPEDEDPTWVLGGYLEADKIVFGPKGGSVNAKKLLLTNPGPFVVSGGEVSISGGPLVLNTNSIVVGNTADGMLALHDSSVLCPEDVPPTVVLGARPETRGTLSVNQYSVDAPGLTLSDLRFGPGSAAFEVINYGGDASRIVRLESPLRMGIEAGSESSLILRGSVLSLPASQNRLVLGEAGSAGAHVAAAEIRGPARWDVLLGDAPGSAGSLLVEGGSVLPSIGELSVGVHGAAWFGVIEQELAAETVSIGRYAGSSGWVSPYHGSLEVTRALTVGGSGTGELFIDSRSTVHSGTADVGSLAGSSGAVTVEGNDSFLKTDDDMYIGGSASGPGGTATVTVREGGKIYVVGTLKIHPEGALILETPKDRPEVVTTVDPRILRLEGGDPSRNIPGGKLTGSGWIGYYAGGATVLNGGTIELLSEDRIGALGEVAAIRISGDYVQSSNGTLSVELAPNDRLTPASHTTGLRAGHATLDGSLRVTHKDDNGDLLPGIGFVPEIGDRFAIVTAQDIEGTFAKFEDPLIEGHNDRFLGVNYRWEPFREVVEVVTLESPRRVIPGVSFDRLTDGKRATNLVLVTHGTNADAAAGSWVDVLARDIKHRADERKHGTWDVATLDWRQYAGGGDDDFKTIPFFDPIQSANNGINIAASLVRWMEVNGLHYESVHVLGHSSGSWLVDAIADELSESSVAPTNIHLTMFDAYAPTIFDFQPFIFRQDGGELVLGDNAGFAEHIVDMAGTGTLLVGTNKILPEAVNAEVTLLNDLIEWNPFASHAFPYEWYTDTVQSPTDPQIAVGGLGFPIAYEYSGIHPSHEEAFERGNHLMLAASAWGIVRGVIFSRISLATSDYVVTGNVTFTPEGHAVLQTESPAILTSFVELTEPTSLLRFDFAFTSESDGLLSVFFDGQQVFEMDSAFWPEELMVADSGVISLRQEFEPGTYTLLFRLDPVGAESAAVEISNVEFGRLQIVPEPSTWAALASMAVTGAAWMLRRRVSANRRRINPFGG